MDRDRINAFPRRMQHPFSLCFWRLGRAALSVLIDTSNIIDATQQLQMCVSPSAPSMSPFPFFFFCSFFIFPFHFFNPSKTFVLFVCIVLQHKPVFLPPCAL
jgi:hypothetical protein